MKNKSYPLYELPAIANLKELLAQKKETQPDKTAFIEEKKRGERIQKTYREVYDEAAALGAYLWDKGLCNRHIAIIGENSYEWLLCFFVVVNSGGVAVPIDKELSEGEIAKLLQKVDVEYIFCSEKYQKKVENAVRLIQGKGIIIDVMSQPDRYIADGYPKLSAQNNPYTAYEIDNQKTCCILFTSGTSGESKGVMLSHENIAADINGSCKLFAPSGGTVAVLPFHHAFGLVVGVFMMFHYGYPVFLNRSLKTIPKDLQSAKPQTLFFVPLFVETFYKQIWAAARKDGKEKLLKKTMRCSDILLRLGIDIRKKAFKSVQQVFGGNLEYIVCGGAPLGTQYIKAFRSWGIEILNGYGTTECSPCIAVNRNRYHKDGTVGMTYPNIEVKVSADGEILVKGAIVMQGYYKNPTETDKVLCNGWYATGDIGSVDRDGFITLTGRKKNLIILSNGENISPEELEADFLKDMAVSEVLVTERQGLLAAEIYPDKSYLAEIHKDSDVAAYFEQLRQNVNKSRPPYKQISVIELRDTEFDKNTSRKIVRYKEEKGVQDVRKSN